MPVVSIIIPVYNTGNILHECFHSIYEQTFKDYEIICVDDYSTDKITKKILKEEERKGNISYYKNVNEKGAAESRNYGLRQASGEYVIFIDSDDYLCHDMLEKMVSEIEREKADVCLCGHEIFCVADGEYVTLTRIIPQKKVVYDRNDEEWIYKTLVVPWNKLVRASYLRENEITFQNLTSCNDVYYSCKTMINACNIAVVYETLINHRVYQENQISANRDPYNMINVFEKLMSESDLYSNVEMYKKYLNALLMMGTFWEIEKTQNKEQIEKAYQYTRFYFLHHKVCFKKESLEIYRKKLCENEDFQWVYERDAYGLKLALIKDSLIDRIKKFDKRYIWGMGAHGKSILNFMNCNRVRIDAVTDVNIEKIVLEKVENVSKMTTEEVLKSGGVIICTNHTIYEYLIKKKYDVTCLIDVDAMCEGI